MRERLQAQIVELQPEPLALSERPAAGGLESSAPATSCAGVRDDDAGASDVFLTVIKAMVSRPVVATDSPGIPAVARFIVITSFRCDGGAAMTGEAVSDHGCATARLRAWRSISSRTMIALIMPSTAGGRPPARNVKPTSRLPPGRDRHCQHVRSAAAANTEARSCSDEENISARASFRDPPYRDG